MITNVFVISMGVTSICLMVLLIFPYVLYARDIRDHLRLGKTYIESVTTTIIWHLLLVIFFSFFFGIWDTLADFITGTKGGVNTFAQQMSPKVAIKAFLNIGGSSESIADYWKGVTESLSHINYNTGSSTSQKSQYFIVYGVGLIALIGMMYWVTLFFLPIFCVLVPIFLSLRYDKLHRDNNDGTMLHKLRFLVYGVAGVIIMGMHFKINDIFINFVADEYWVGTYQTSSQIWRDLARP